MLALVLGPIIPVAIAQLVVFVVVAGIGLMLQLLAVMVLPGKQSTQVLERVSLVPVWLGLSGNIIELIRLPLSIVGLLNGTRRSSTMVLVVWKLSPLLWQEISLRRRLLNLVPPLRRRAQPRMLNVVFTCT